MGTFYLMPKARLKIDKQQLNLETATVKITLHDSTLSYSDSYEFFNEIQASEIATANGYTQGGLAVLNKSFALYGTDSVSFDSDDPAGWTVTGTGFTFRWWVARVDTGNPATDPVVGIYDYGSNVNWAARALGRTVEFNPTGWWNEPFRPSSAEVPANIASANVASSSPAASGFTLTAAAGTAAAIANTAEADEVITFRFAKLATQGIPGSSDIIVSGKTAAQFEAGVVLSTVSSQNTTVYAYIQSVSSKYGANPNWLEFAVAIPANSPPTFVSNVNLSSNPQTKAGTLTNSGWYISYDYTDPEGDAVVVKLLVKTSNSYVESDWNSATTITPPISASVVASDNYFEYQVTGKANSTTYYYWVRLEDASNTGASATTSSAVAVTTLSTSSPTWAGGGNALALSATTYTGFTATMNAAATDPEGGLVLYEPNYKKSTDGTWTIHTKYHSLLRGAISEVDASSAVTAAALANALKQSYEAHRQSTREHSSADSTNTITAGNASSGDTNSITALANDLKAKYNLHRVQTSVHLTNDSTNTITSADATDLASAYTLLNELKTDYNLHIGQPYTVSGLSLAAGTWQVKYVAKDPDGGTADSETDTFSVYDLTCTVQAPTSVASTSLTANGTAGTNSRTATKLRVWIGPATLADNTPTADPDNVNLQKKEYTSLSIASGATFNQAVTGLSALADAVNQKIWLSLGSDQDGYQSWPSTPQTFMYHQVPSQPTITATAGNAQVAVTVTNHPVTVYGSGVTLANYIYEKATDSGFTANLQSKTTSAGSYTFQNGVDSMTVTNGTLYYFRVRAVDSLTSSSANSSNATATPTSGPVHKYTFESQNANDSGSGTAYNGTVTGATFVTGLGSTSYAANFDGVNDEITFADPVSTPIIPKGAKTIKFKYKKNGNPAALGMLIANGGSSSANHGWAILVDTAGKIQVWSSKGGGGMRCQFTSATGVCDNTEHSIKITWDGTTDTGMVKLYIDNMSTPDATATAAATETTDPTNSTKFGNDAANNWGAGILDEVEFYNAVV